MEPYTIHIPQQTLNELQERLVKTRWPAAIVDSDWQYGTSQPYLQELVQYWQHEFDWRKQEAMLNQFANFRTEIDGFRLHVIHI